MIWVITKPDLVLLVRSNTSNDEDQVLMMWQEYFNFHRIDMHNVLLDTVKAESSKEKGPQGRIVVNHKALEVDAEKEFVRFENGSTTTGDLVIAADGIRVSSTRIVSD
jgi:salicylate hydroxylase